LTRVITVSNPLHTQTLREKPNTAHHHAKPTPSRRRRRGLRGSGAQPRLGVWGLGPQKTPFWADRRRREAPSRADQAQKGRPAVRSLGVASPRGADAGPRGEVSGESFGQKSLIVYSVSG
jgi:hypothetical protein